jgi:hypothetical protein
MSPILLPASSQRPVLVQLGKRKPVADLAPRFADFFCRANHREMPSAALSDRTLA